MGKGGHFNQNKMKDHVAEISKSRGANAANTAGDTGASTRVRERAKVDRAHVLHRTSRCYCVIALQCAVANEQQCEPCVRLCVLV